ncbi:MAG TPA: 2OG-Fe(II) oxygenase [Chitinophagaceae bacterium]|nr:2OG-Fe(II) oxygenase [Chitinophagaceae bacterium]
MTQEAIAGQIAQHLTQHKDALRHYWEQSGPVRHFYLDDLLPAEWAMQFYQALPDPKSLLERNSIKERKRVGIKLENYDQLIGFILFAFQDQVVLDIVSAITGCQNLHADRSLYGSGVSVMIEGDFLMPHLDNSHDGDGEEYRVLNALYYISPGWQTENGGNLELWNESMGERKEITAAFNRLIMMETDTASIHSVNKVLKPGGVRACISNYYFSQEPTGGASYIHKTTFFARPEDGPVKKMRLFAEATLKRLFSGLITNKVKSTKHRRGH